MNTHPPSKVVLFCATVVALTFAINVAQSAEVRGRVFDAATFVGLEGAVVTLDLLPADGTPEFTTSADVFGLYSITNIPAGSYRLRATHPGYTPGQSDEVLATNTKLGRNFPLTRLPGDPTRFKIVTEVSCVKSGLRLGGVRVLVERFSGPADVTPAATFTNVTDGDGRATLYGATDGHYVITVNATNGSPSRPRWESFVSPRKAIHAPHLAVALLKPVPQTMTVQVRGFDPTLSTAGLSNQPLRNIYVELEGVDPADPNSVLLPPRVGTTDSNGEAQFTDLPGIAWRATAKRLGYNPATNVFFPVNDTLTASVTMTNSHMPIPFGVAIDSQYLNPLLMTGLVMRVTGFTNSNTEGITRTTTSFLFDPPGPPPPFASAVVPGLIAGRYEVAITGLVQSAAIKSGAFSTTGRFDVVFSGSQTFDAFPGMPFPAMMAIQPELATVRVRYHSADGMSEVQVAGTNGVLTNRPAFARSFADLLVFKESAVTNQLKPPFRMTMFDTDASGEAVIKILPGVYGLEAPTMTEYFGSDCRIHDATTGETLTHGWPFANNPDTGPFPSSPHHALGLRFSSGHQYEVDLFARKKTYDVRGEVKLDPADPVTQRVIAVAGTESAVVPITELTDGGTATLAGHPPVKPLTLTSQTITNANPAAPTAEFFFEDVEPGTNSLTLAHPRNTFTAFSGGSSLSVVLPDYGPPGIVDGSDMTNAAAGLFPLQTLRLKSGGGGPAFSATFTAPPTDTVKLSHYRWITNAGGSYVLEAADILSPNFFVPDPSPSSLLYRYAGASRFKMVARDWFLYYALNATNWFKAGFISTNTAHEFVFNAYSGGPSNNVIGPLVEAYDFSVRAESDADATLSISGLSVSFLGGGMATTPFSTGAWTNGYVPTSVSPQTSWIWPGNYTVTQPVPGEFQLTLKMRRGMGVSGLVRDATNSVALTNARVQLLDRFGSLLQATNSATNGAYVFSALPVSQPVFLDITAPGYVQSRVRLTPTEGSPDVASTNSLVQLGQPKILTNTLDRYGIFLPRVRKSGSTGNYTDFTATDALTMHWSLLANEHKFILDIPEFDSPSGGTRSAFEMLTDAIEESWLVDARGFSGDPYSAMATNLNLPPATNAAAIRTWLNNVRGGAFGNVFARRVSGRMPEPLPGTNVVVQATQPLWELPNGGFRPVFVALTKRGSASISEVNYTGAETNKMLFGEPLPGWLAFTADLFGYVAGFQAASGIAVTDEHVDRFMPSGRFKALPQFTANISTNDGFLNYEYGLAISWKEGQNTPRSGFLLLAPRTIGLEFGAGLAFGLDGAERKFSLDASASFSGGTNLASLAPAGLPVEEQPQGGFSVNASTAISQSYANPGNRVSLLEIKNTVGGNLSGSVKVNAEPVTSKLPYVGPALLGLSRGEILKLFATINGGVGLQVVNRWRTEYPPSQFDDTFDPTQKLNYRRHLFGGAEDIGFTTGENSLDLCFRFGVGLEVSVAKGTLTGTVDLNLQGNPCGGLDALLITPTTNSFGLPVVRVNGALNLSAGVTLDVGAASFSQKLLSVDLIPIDVQFGTESSFYFVQMQDTTTVLFPSAATAENFSLNGPDRVKNFYRAGATTPAVAGSSFTYTDINPTNGHMLIKLVGTDCQGELPVTVADAPGILSVATLRLASGQWLVAWSEVAAADIGNPFAASTIKYSLSGTNCLDWSTGAVVAAVSDLATDLRFVNSGSLTGLVWLHAADGPLSLRRGASGTTWNGATWSTVAELISPQDIADFDAVGSGGSATPPALLAWSDTAGLLRSLTWSGASTTGPHTIATNNKGALDLAVNAAGQFHCAWNSTNGGVNLSRFDGVSSWTLLGTPATGVTASELQLAPLTSGGTNIWLLAWIDATDSKLQSYAFATATGATLKPATQTAFADTGRYSGLQVQPLSGLSARIIVRHTGTNNVTNLREYVATPSGIAPWLLNASRIGGGLQFDVTASPNQNYRLQGSSNLVNWVDLQSFSATNSPILLQDTSGLPLRFYRAVSP
jgi:hypothetical protein